MTTRSTTDGYFDVDDEDFGESLLDVGQEEYDEDDEEEHEADSDLDEEEEHEYEDGEQDENEDEEEEEEEDAENDHLFDSEEEDVCSNGVCVTGPVIPVSRALIPGTNINIPNRPTSIYNPPPPVYNTLPITINSRVPTTILEIDDSPVVTTISPPRIPHQQPVTTIRPPTNIGTLAQIPSQMQPHVFPKPTVFSIPSAMPIPVGGARIPSQSTVVQPTIPMPTSINYDQMRYVIPIPIPGGTYKPPQLTQMMPTPGGTYKPPTPNSARPTIPQPTIPMPISAGNYKPPTPNGIRPTIPQPTMPMPISAGNYKPPTPIGVRPTIPQPTPVGYNYPAPNHVQLYPPPNPLPGVTHGLPAIPLSTTFQGQNTVPTVPGTYKPPTPIGIYKPPTPQTIPVPTPGGIRPGIPVPVPFNVRPGIPVNIPSRVGIAVAGPNVVLPNGAPITSTTIPTIIPYTVPIVSQQPKNYKELLKRDDGETDEIFSFRTFIAQELATIPLSLLPDAQQFGLADKTLSADAIIMLSSLITKKKWFNVVYPEPMDDVIHMLIEISSVLGNYDIE
jgi:hypothetical protein